MSIKLKKVSFPSVKILRILAELIRTELLTVGKWSLKNLVAVVSSCPGARIKEPVLLECSVLGSAVYSLRAPLFQ